MRKLTLLLLPLVGACGDAAAANPKVIESFRERATALSCEPVRLGVDVAATEIRLTSDTTWTLLDGPQRAVLTFTDDLGLVDRTRIPAAGPGSGEHPVSAVRLGDTAVAVLSRGGLNLAVLATDGAVLRHVPLDFAPNALAASDAGLLATPIPFGDRPPTLLLRNRGSEWEPLPVPKRDYPDMSIAALGNAALLEVFPDGRVLVVHQYFRPRAFIVRPDGTLDAVTPPVPDGVASQTDFVPRAPITDDQIRRTLVPAMAITIDPRRSEVYVLTRSGAEIGERFERAILRLTDRLEFIEGYTFPVMAVSMVYLPRRHAALLVDDMDRFHICALGAGAVAG